MRKIDKITAMWEASDGRRIFALEKDCAAYEALIAEFDGSGEKLTDKDYVPHYIHYVQDMAQLSRLNQYYGQKFGLYFSVRSPEKYAFPCKVIVRDSFDEMWWTDLDAFKADIDDKIRSLLDFKSKL